MKLILLNCFIAVSLSACIQTAATGYENLDNASFAEKMKDTGVVIIDVRTLDEYQRGHIPRSIQLDYYSADFKSQVSKLDRKKTYLLYCGAGGRSVKASKILKEKGYDTVYTLDHGFNNWEGPVEK